LLPMILLGGVVEGATDTVGKAAALAISAPVSVFDSDTRETLEQQTTSLGATAGIILWQFLVEAATLTTLGAGIGLIIGQIIYYIHKLFSTTTNIATALTLITPYIMYLTAEHFHYSGVLAVVSGGLFLSSRAHEILNHKARLQSAGVWHTLAFILNGLIFILIGLQLPHIVNGLKYYTITEGIEYGLIISGLIIIIRLIWIFAATYLPVLMNKRRRKDGLIPNPREIFLIGWAGMRGVISLASALAIPVTLADGNEFPERDLVLFISFVVILVTLVGQGLSLPWVIRKLKLTEDKLEIPADIQAQQIHFLLMKLSLELLEEKYSGLMQSNTLIRTLKQKLENELGFTRMNIDSLKTDANEKQQVQEYNQVLLEIGKLQQRQLAKMGSNDLFDEEVIRREEARIDLDQNKIG